MQNPTGRVLNRFSGDLDKVDGTLPTIACDTFRLAFTVVGAVAVCAAVLPWLLLALPAAYYLFRRVQRYFLATSRELARLQGVSRSPLVALFSSTLEGLVVVRAAGLVPHFDRKLLSLLDLAGRPTFLELQGRRWVAIRFDAVANLIITAVAALLAVDSLAATTGAPALSAGLAGVVLTQSLQLIGVFQYGVRQAAETENTMTSVERIRAYGNLAQEGSASGRR